LNIPHFVCLTLFGASPGQGQIQKIRHIPLLGGDAAMKKLGELMMILDLHHQGVNIATIARQVGVDRKTFRKYIARGVEG